MFNLIIFSGTSKTFLIPSPVNIRQIQRQAEQIIRRREQERNRDAQEIQRNLDEIEQRKSEVRSVGADLERRLRFTPKSQWLLENWLLYAEELAQLERREQILNKRVREISSAQEYIQLKAELNRISTTKESEIGSNFKVGFEQS